MQNTFTLQKAEKRKLYIKLALIGPSGSGKTFSALRLAKGLAKGDMSKVALIDTENGSGSLYSSYFKGYEVIDFEPPFTPDRYKLAIESCVRANKEVIIIDSGSHEWDGSGGVLEIVDGLMKAGRYKSSVQAWGVVTPKHNSFIQAFLQARCHVIMTYRSKTETVLEKENDVNVVKKYGLKAVTRDGIEYEFTTVFDLDRDNLARISKDRTSLFAEYKDLGLQITEKIGEQIRAWADSEDRKSIVIKEDVKKENTQNTENIIDEKKPNKKFTLKFIYDSVFLEGEEKIPFEEFKKTILENQKASSEDDIKEDVLEKLYGKLLLDPTKISKK